MKLDWRRLAPGVWSSITGENPLTLTGHGGAGPAAGLERCSETELPDLIRCGRFGDSIVLRIPIGDDEQVFGGGLRFEGLRWRHAVCRLRVDHSSGVDNGRTHVPTPFHVTTAGYGLFIDTPEAVTYYIGTAQRLEDKKWTVERDRATDPNWQCVNAPFFIEIAIRANAVKLVLFRGTDMKDCVSRFNLYCGGGCLPPKWGLGFWHRTNISMTDREVLRVADEYEKRRFPLDVLGLEPGWQSASYPCTYEWSERTFPDPAGFLAQMTARGIRVNLWENPYISEKSSLYPKLLPYAGSHLVWCGIAPDYSLPEVRSTLETHFMEHHLSVGVSGYKLDESDGFDTWLWPDHAIFPSGKNGFTYRNLCGLLFQRITFEACRRGNRRTFGLTRSSNGGGVSFPYVIYNDRYDFREYLTALCSCGFAGALWGPELRNAQSPNDWLRRFQLAAVSPLMQLNAWADDSMPWMYPEVETAVREAVLLRRKLVPYLYSAFARYHFEGIPPFRPVFLDYGFFLSARNEAGTLDSTANPYREMRGDDIPDQFILGDFIMAAPLEPEQKARSVVFPPGKWFDFYTGEFVSEGGVKEIAIAPDAPLPLFVPDGAVVPLDEDGEITIRHFGSGAGSFVLYDDDGVSFDYEQGRYTRTLLRSDGTRELL